jgi:hypothetical protein
VNTWIRVEPIFYWALMACANPAFSLVPAIAVLTPAQTRFHQGVENQTLAPF